MADYRTYEEQHAAEEAGFVGCDHSDCQARAEPDRTNLKEVLAALDHWEGHGWLSGCSHAC